MEAWRRRRVLGSFALAAVLLLVVGVVWVLPFTVDNHNRLAWAALIVWGAAMAAAIAVVVTRWTWAVEPELWDARIAGSQQLEAFARARQAEEESARALVPAAQEAALAQLARERDEAFAAAARTQAIADATLRALVLANLLTEAQITQAEAQAAHAYGQAAYARAQADDVGR